MTNAQYLSAKEAARELGVTLPTLYVYVSRGLIRSEEAGGDPRARRYRREDIDHLKLRKEARRKPEVLAESALHLGTPVLESAITLINDGALYYRGHDALELAVRATPEQVAALIWLDDLDADTSALFGGLELPAICRDIGHHLARLSAFEKFQVLLPLAAVDDLAAYDTRPSAVAATGARIVQMMAALAAGREDMSSGLAQTLQQGWIPDDPQAADLIGAALILCADHELNASSFTARCVASTNATPYAVVSAGLAALQGAKHGGHTGRVEAFLNEIDSPDQAQTVMASRLKRGEGIPGFGHPLYPDGDPRGRMLLHLAADAYPDSPATLLGAAVAGAALTLVGEHPTIDLGLVILAQALNLPPGSALTLFAIGRTIGWIGQAIEQYQIDRLIRPRARYTGRQPS